MLMFQDGGHSETVLLQNGACPVLTRSSLPASPGQSQKGTAPQCGSTVIDARRWCCCFLFSVELLHEFEAPYGCGRSGRASAHNSPVEISFGAKRNRSDVI